VDLTIAYSSAVKKLTHQHPQDGKLISIKPTDLIANASNGKKYMSKNLKPHWMDIVWCKLDSLSISLEVCYLSIFRSNP
jgi:hypothetical protein